MARNFTAANDHLSYSPGAVEFQSGTAWTTFAWFRVENTASDDRAIISQWAAASSTRQFLLRTDTATAPTRIEVYTNGTLSVASNNDIQLNTWYFVAVAHDGTTGGTSTTLWIFAADLTLVNSYSDQHDGNKSIVTDIVIGGTAGNADSMDGDIAHAGYFKTELTTESQIRELAAHPGRVCARYGAEWYAPIIGASPEPDWSGNGNNFTVAAGSSVSDNPPSVAPWFGFDNVPVVGGAEAPAGALEVYVIS